MKETRVFIKENAQLILDYINEEVLQGIGEMNFNYFKKVLQDIDLNKYNEKLNIFPYFIFTLIEGKGRLDYTSLRVETINFNQINKEASVYYNYAKFSLKNEFLCIDLMQTKIGGMPIDNDIVKFTKNVPINNFGLEEFINKNKKY